MTQEEKAKAYDEALKQAKFYHGNCPSEPERKKLEKMFPVLHESDDERVRKWLIAQMSSIVSTEAVKELDKDGYEMARKAIIYLEKRKENQYFVGYAKGYSEGQLNPKQKERKPILEVFGFKVGDAVRLKDGDGRKHIIKSFEEVEGVHGPNFYHVEFEDNSARDGIYPGEEYPNGYYTQMEKFEEERKPEWSDEDERKLQKCIKIVERWEEDHDIAYAPYSGMLKSLRPHWKPSEEQIRTLDIVISDYRHACTKDSDKKAEILKPLLEQLRKL